MSASKKPLYEDLVDMTAMVDIVFFVLIFFMTTAMQKSYTAIEMPTADRDTIAHQGAPALPKPEDGCVVVRIDRDDTVWVNDSEVAGNSERELRIRLSEARAAGAGSNKMVVLGSSGARHGTLVTVLDAGSDAGMAEIQLAVDDEG